MNDYDNDNDIVSMRKYYRGQLMIYQEIVYKCGAIITRGIKPMFPEANDIIVLGKSKKVEKE